MRSGDSVGSAETLPIIVVAMDLEQQERFFPSALAARLETTGRVVHIPGNLHAPEAMAGLRSAEVLITGWGTARIDDTVLEDAPRLRGIVHAAGSVKAVVSKDVYRRGIVVSSQARANALPVAEYTLAMILLGAKGVLAAQRRYRDTRRRFDVLTELADHGTVGRRVGIIGASVIGRRVIELLTPFDLEIVVADPTLTEVDAASLGVRLLTLEELLATSAVVSLHAPLLPVTAGMIGAAELARLPDGAVFINTARGALVDEEAMVRELLSGRIEAILDVTDPEPPDASSPLWDLPNVTLTPHVAGAAGTELHRLGASAVAEVRRVLRGEPLQHPVTEERYDSLA
jgi:phosphoglycerate dehydrogenase-like enzyme